MTYGDHYRIGRGEGCPWCSTPVAEHEQRDGFVHRVWLCPNAPHGWRGVFYDEPVGQPAQKGDEAK